MAQEMMDDRPHIRFELLQAGDEEGLRDYMRVRVTESALVESCGQCFYIPKGFICDAASTPRAVWAMYPPIGPWTEGAIAHDLLYLEGCCSRATADNVFYDLMLRCNVVKRTRKIMYYAVRVGGWKVWRRYRKLEEYAERYEETQAV